MMDWEWSTALYAAQNFTKQPHHPSTITLASPKTKTDNFLSSVTTSNPPPSLSSFHYPDLNTAPSSSSFWDHQNQNNPHGGSLNNQSCLPTVFLNSSYHHHHHLHLMNSSSDHNPNCNIPVSSHSSNNHINTTTTNTTTDPFNMISSTSSSNLNQSPFYPITTSSHSTSPSLLHNHQQTRQQQALQPAFYAQPTPFPISSTSPGYVTDPSSQCVEALHRSSSSSSDISKSPQIGYQPHLNHSSESLASSTHQAGFFGSTSAPRIINLQNGRRLSSGGSVHSDLSGPSGQPMGSPDFESLSLDYYNRARTSDAASIGSIGSSSSLSGLSYQYEGSEPRTHSSPEAFSAGHSRQSSTSSSVPTEPLLPAFSLADLYTNQTMSDAFHVQNRTLEGLCASGLGGIQPDAFNCAEQRSHLPFDHRDVESNHITSELQNFSPTVSAMSEHRQTHSTIPNTFTAKGPRLNISTNVATHSTYLHPNDALRLAPTRATPKRQRSRSEGDLLSKLLSHAQSGTFSVRQMLEDDAGVKHMAAIALSPKTPIEFHAENHFQFPSAIATNVPNVDYNPSNLFLSPTSTFENDNQLGALSPSGSSGHSRIGRRRAVSAARVPPDGFFNPTEGDLTPLGQISNQSLPFQHPLHEQHLPLSDFIPPSNAPPQIILSDELRSRSLAAEQNGIQSTASVPNLTPQFMSPTMNNKMEIDEPPDNNMPSTSFIQPGSASLESQFLPFESPAACFRLLHGDSQAPRQVPTQTPSGLGGSSSTNNNFPPPDHHRFPDAERERANEMSLPFNSRPGSLETTSHRISDPFLDFCSALDSHAMTEKNQQSHQARTSTGWSSSPPPIFDFGPDQHQVRSMHSSSPGALDDFNGEGSSSGALTSPNIFNGSIETTPQHPYDYAAGNIGGRIRRTAPATRKCSECNATFTRNDRLKYHFDAKHAKVPPTCSCPVPGCPKSFRQKSDLSRHIKSVHRELNQAGHLNCQESPSNRIKRNGT